MSITTVEVVAERFLSQSKSGVLVLKGAWGVGKTYAWQHLVKRVRDRIYPKTYAYVSLFGISSLADLRIAIIANSRPTEALGEALTLDAINRNWASLGRSKLSGFWARLAAAQGGQLIKGVNVAFELLAPMFVRNMVICFDDFERLNTARVSHEDLLGFISTLKETSDCKIVMVMNDAKLPPGDNAYVTYREKIVDVELQFSPTADEAIQWGLPHDLWERARVKTCVLALQIRNVRVLAKIADVIQLLEPDLREMHVQVREVAVRSAVLLTWCHFDKSDSAPSISFLRTWNTITAELKKRKEKPTAEQLRWESLVGGYRFEPYSDIDLAVEAVITRGYVEESGFREQAAKLDAMYRAGDQEQEFTAAWNLFHNSFRDNEPEVVAGLRDGLRNAVLQVNPGNLSATLQLLRGLGHDQLANELLDYYVQQRRDEPLIFDLAQNPFANQITDKPTREAFDREASRVAKGVPLRQAAETIAVAGGWSAEVQAALSAATADELYDLFKGELSVPLHRVVQACLRFNTPPTDHIAKRADEALRRIAAESNINAIRVRRYGIDTNEVETASDAAPGSGETH